MNGPDALLPMLDAIFRGVVRASLEGGLFVVVILAVTRLVPRIPARARAALWWVACARFVVSLTGLPPLGVPLVVPAPLAVAAPHTQSTAGRADAIPAASASDATRPVPFAASPAAFDSPSDRTTDVATGRSPRQVMASLMPSWPWTAWVALAWLALAATAFARIVLGLWRSMVVVQGATRADESVLPMMRRVVDRFGLAAPPDVRVTDAVRAPQLVWYGHAVVLLPTAALDSWTAQDVELALAHETAHLRRHDLAWGLVAAVVGRTFAFHPLARLAAREYALAREAACDAEVLARTDASAFDYGRLLLTLGVTRRPALSLSSAAWSGRSLKRRLVMLEHHPTIDGVRSKWIVLPVALLAALVGLTAAAPGPVADEQTAPSVQAAEAPAPAVGARSISVMDVADVAKEPQAAPPAPPKPPAAPRAPAPPPPPPPPYAHGAHVHAIDDVADAWVYLSSGRSFQNGSRHDRRIAEKLQQGTESMFWFARDGNEYVIRDKATLARIEQLFAPEREFADDQHELARSQAELAEKQAQIAAEQADVASRVAELGARQAALGAEQATLRAEMIATKPDQGVEEAKVRDLEVKAREYEHKMQQLETEMRAHEERMRAFEPRHEALARQMEQRAREVEAKMAQSALELKDLLTKAVASGTAQPVR